MGKKLNPHNPFCEENDGVKTLVETVRNASYPDYFAFYFKEKKYR